MVVPVGDLAAQVHKVFSDHCQHTELRVGMNLNSCHILFSGSLAWWCNVYGI